MSSYGIDQTFSGPKSPWKGIGVELDHPATAEEAIKLAGLDWPVGKKDVYIKDKKGSFHTIQGKKAITRRDNGHVFAVTSDRYEPLQNTEACDALDFLVQDGSFEYQSAGSINGGARVWLFGTMTDGVYDIGGGDTIQRGILLTNSHDGTSAVTLRFMDIRQKCYNVLSGLFRGSGDFRAIHTTNLARKMTEARGFMGLEQQYHDRLMAGIEAMSQERLDQFYSGAVGTKHNKERFLRQLFGQELDATEVSTRTRNQMDTVGDLFHNGMGCNGETRWDMFNAVVEFVDHHKGSDDEKRLGSAWFGSGQTMKQRAWELLTPATA